MSPVMRCQNPVKRWDIAKARSFLFYFFPKSISEMLGFSFRSLPRGARFEWTLRVAGAGAAGRRLRRGSEV